MWPSRPARRPPPVPSRVKPSPRGNGLVTLEPSRSSRSAPRASRPRPAGQADGQVLDRMVVRTSFSGRRGRHSAPGGTRARSRSQHARIILVVLGVCSVVFGGTLAGLAATGAGGGQVTPGAVTGASGGGSGAGRLNATSPARAAASPTSQRPTPGAGKASRTSASPSATAAGRLNPFGAAAASYLSGRAGTVVAAVYDIGTGRTWDLGHSAPQAEASVVKLDILETLLAERGQGSSIGLSASDRTLAEQMIENSDNAAATSLWYAAGGPAK